MPTKKMSTGPPATSAAPGAEAAALDQEGGAPASATPVKRRAPATPRVRVEFTVEPFVEGRLGPHVQAAVGSLRRQGFDPDVGPFGTTVDGDAGTVLDAVARAARASFGAGATGITLNALVVAEPDADAEAGDDGSEAFLAAVGPVARAIGGSVVPIDAMGRDAVPLRWKGRVVGGLERPEPSDLRNGLAAVVASIEAELGGGLAALDRVGKQRAVRMLDERGAFAIRNAVDEVADAMGVSRVTVYNYLNATRSSGGSAFGRTASRPRSRGRDHASRS